MSRQPRIRANENLWALDYVQQMLKSLRAGEVTTRYVLDHSDGSAPIEFELRVTKFAALSGSDLRAIARGGK